MVVTVEGVPGRWGRRGHADPPWQPVPGAQPCWEVRLVRRASGSGRLRAGSWWQAASVAWVALGSQPQQLPLLPGQGEGAGRGLPRILVTAQYHCRLWRGISLRIWEGPQHPEGR